MISTYDVFIDIIDKCWNADVVPLLRVFGYQDVTAFQSETLNFVFGCCCLHEHHRRTDAFIFIHVCIIA